MSKADRFAELRLVAEQRAASGGTTVVPSYHAPDTTDTTATNSTSGTTEKWSRPNLEQLNLKIQRQIKAKFEMWCLQNGMSMAQGFREMVERVTTSSGGTTDTTATALLIDDSSEIDDIVSLYRNLTGNKWTDADRQALSEIQGVPAMRIMVGVALSVARAKTRVNSFRYCHGAIAEAADSPVADVQQYLAYVKSKIRAGKG